MCPLSLSHDNPFSTWRQLSNHLKPVLCKAHYDQRRGPVSPSGALLTCSVFIKGHCNFKKKRKHVWDLFQHWPKVCSGELLGLIPPIQCLGKNVETGTLINNDSVFENANNIQSPGETNQEKKKRKYKCMTNMYICVYVYLQTHDIYIHIHIYDIYVVIYALYNDHRH